MKWVLLDFETSGLADDSEILEVAAHHVGKHTLELKGPPFDLKLVHIEQPPMDPVALEMHQKSGLLQELDEARTAILHGHVPSGCVLNYAQLDDALFDYLSQVANNKSRSVYLVGNTVNFDWGFVKRRLPRSFIMLSHRVVDVSQTRTLWQAWCAPLVRGNVAHRARGDVMMSLAGLRFTHQIFEVAKQHGVFMGDMGSFAKEQRLATSEDSPL
jgi:oligoribonuclease (3'-5' exoribonuclease)